MSALLTLESISLAAPDGRLLFEGLSLAVGREQIGLVGRNGSGKSTLLRLMAGKIEPAAGSVERAGSVGVYAQPNEDLAVAQALGVADALARLGRLERGEGSEVDAGEADWTLKARLQEALGETGLSGLPLDRRLSSLSGGEQTRVALARVLIEAPDLLLLDEPTNNLDAEGRAAVGRLLERWRGGAVVASHDRALLERVDRIVELTPVGVTAFGGAWPQFAQARAAARERAQAGLARAELALRQAEREVQETKERQDRRDKIGRAKRTRGDAPKILLDAQAERAEKTRGRGSRLAERMIGDKAQTLKEARSHIEILTPVRMQLPKIRLAASRELVDLRNAVMAHGGRRIFGPISFAIRGPQRIALIGPNGSGKTTLLRLIAGELGPTAGEVRRLTDRIAMLDQHVAMLDPGVSVLDNLRRLNPDLSDNEARAAAARFAFRSDAALELTGALSAGERLRAGLGCVFARRNPPYLLLLDEPTNYLDLDTIEDLEAALCDFDGALIVASHDRAFLEAIGADREIALENGRVRCSFA